MTRKKTTILRARIPRAALALLLVATLVPLVGFTHGSAQEAPAIETLDAAAALPATGSTSGSQAARADKDEVIYALLNSDGTARAGYVINHFKVNAAGNLADQGAYSSATNLSTTDELVLSGNQVTVPVEAGDFYYQGVLSTVELPWDIAISYRLDGKLIDPAQLAGSSGKLEIAIKTSQNKKAAPVFYENYLLQIQLTLSTAHTSNLQAPGATIASVGKDEQIAFMVLPGKQGDLSLTAQVSEFEMGGIQISGVPFSMVFEIPDTGGMLDDMAELTDAIGELNDGVGKLKEGIGELSSGAPSLSSGSSEIQYGLTLLSNNAALLTDASGQIDAALAMLAQQAASGGIDATQMALLVDGLRQLSAGLYSGDPANPGLAEGLYLIQDGLYTVIGSLDWLINGIPLVDGGDIYGLYADPGLSALDLGSQLTIGALIDVNTQAATLAGYWNAPGGLQDGLYEIAGNLDAPINNCAYMAGQLSAMADGLEANLSLLADLTLLIAYLQQISGEYSTFHEGLASYAAGVNTVAVSYTAFDSGLNQFLAGTTSLYEGMAALHDGTTELYVNVEDLPATLQKEIDGFLEDYRVGDFELVSFTSANNTDVNRVQFVLLTDAIKLPEVEKESTDIAPVERSFWDRFIALFK